MTYSPDADKNTMAQKISGPRLSLRVGVALGEIVLLLLAGAAGAAFYRLSEHHEVVDSGLGCVDTVIASSNAPTGPSMAEGGSLTFKDDIAPGHGTKDRHILNVYIPPGSYPIGSVGDNVRVCLLAMPAKQNGCDPSIDVRGREFLVYDRANAFAEVYQNGEHGCGGA